MSRNLPDPGSPGQSFTGEVAPFLKQPHCTSQFHPTASAGHSRLRSGSRWWLPVVVFLCSLGFSLNVAAQTPGVIYKRAIGGASVLDPNGDGYTSPSNTGFSGTDQGAGSEIPYKAIPQISLEPTSDLGPGPNCGFTDIVDNGAETGVSMYVDAASNYMFRFRLGGSAPNSKGYSILFDIDQKLGFTGPNADPNAVAGNPGFEFEIELATNFGVRLYYIDGRSTPVLLTVLPYADYAQKSIALTTNCGDPDYFYDFYMPLSVITSNLAAPGSGLAPLTFNNSTPFRVVANTIIAPQSALQQTTISDLNGVNLSNYNGNVDAAWTAAGNNGLPTSGSTLQGGGNFGLDRSATPTVSGPIIGGNTSVSGTSTEPNGTQIIIYQNGAPICTTSVLNGAFTCSGISTSTLTLGSTVTATATATGKSTSAISNSVTVGGTCSVPPTITCISQKGVEVTAASGTNLTGLTIRIYRIEPTGGTTFVGVAPIQSGSTNVYFYKCNINNTNCNSGTNCLPDGTYYATQQESGKCESEASGLQCQGLNSTTAAPTVSTNPILAGSTTLSGTAVASTATVPVSVYIYANGIQIGTAAVSTTGTYTATGLNLQFGQQITVRALRSGSCASAATTAITVTAVSDAPVITTPIYAGATSVSGTSSEAAGTTITVYKGGVAIGTTTVSANGTWTLTGVTLSGGDVITARAQATGELLSPVSNSVTVLQRTGSAPVVQGTYTEGQTSVSGISSSPAGTVINVYVDDYLIGTTTVQAGGTWTLTGLSSNPPELYAGGVIYATATETGKGESVKSNTVTIGCPNLQSGNAVTAVPSTICTGATTDIQVTGSIEGIVYTLRNNANTADIGTSRVGTGGTILIGTVALSSTQTIRVDATKIGAVLCQQLLTNTATVTVNPFPNTNNTVTSNSPVCTNSTASITVANSQTGFSYQLRSGTTNVGTAVAGTGGSIVLTTGPVAFNSTTTYNVLVTGVAPSNCSAQLTQTLTVREDCPAVYTVTTKTNRDAFVNNFVVASATDPDGAINAAAIVSGTLPTWLTLAPNGTITVNNAASVVAGTYTFSVQTTDANGGITVTPISFTVIADAEAVYTVNPVNTTAAANTVLASATDGNGAIISAVLNSGTLPAGTTLNANGSVTVTTPGSLVPGSYLVNITTTDVTGGITQQNVTLVVNPAADIAITNTVAAGPYYNGQNVTYTVTATNNGPSQATGLNVTDLLPTGLQFVSATATGTSYNSATGLWTINTLNSGQTVTLTLVARPQTTGSFTTTASVTALTQFDPNTANNTASNTITVGASADVSVVTSASAGPYNVGQPVSFYVTTSNNGPNAATGLSITDLLPAGFTYSSATAPTGTSYSSASGVWTVPTLNSGQSQTLTIVGTPTATGSYTNTANITAQTQFDPNTANNTSSTTITVAPSANVGVNLTVASPGPYYQGKTETFTVTVTNTGPSTATGIVVSDNLPSGFTYITGSGNPSVGTISPTTGQWSIPSLAPGQTATLTLQAYPNTSGTVSATASIAQLTEFDPQLSNNTSTLTLNVLPAADVAITNSVSAGPYYVGQQVVYVVTAQNNGPAAATSLSVTDLLPAGLTFNSATASAGSYVSGTGVWTIGTLNSGASQTLSILATPSAAGNYTTSASVTNNGTTDLNTANNTSSNTITVGASADLSVSKTVSAAPYPQNGNITYTVVVTNNGPSNATAVRISDVLPTGLTFVSSTATTSSYNNGTGIWGNFNLNSGSTATLTITATITATANTSIVNTASVQSSGQFDPVTSNNSNSASITVGVATDADVAVTMSASSGPYYVGRNVTFTVFAANNGPAQANNVRVTDQIPSGMTLVSAIPSQGSYNQGTGVWNIGDITVNAIPTLTLVLTPTTVTSYTNTATKTAQQNADYATTNNAASQTITISPSANVGLSQTVSAGPYYVGQNLTYTLTAANTGPSTATNIQIYDPLPAGLSYVSSTTSGSTTYDPATGIWTIPSLASGASATVSVTATPSTSGTVALFATINSQTEFDPVTSNNSVTNTITVNPTSDLSITNTVSSGPYYQGQNVTYVVAVNNLGPSSATGVSVTDLLPAGLTFVSATTSSGSYISGTGVWNPGTISAGATQTLTIVATPTASGTINNTATITANASFDPNTANNSATSTITVGAAANVGVNLAVVSPGPYYQGQTETFVVTVTNTGPATATNIVVSDNLPQGLTYVTGSGNPSTGTISPSTGLWTIPTLAVGQSATLTLQATPTVTGTVSATASIVSQTQFDSNTANNSSTLTLNVAPAADVAISSTVSAGPYYVGQDVVYVITATNNGPRPATNLLVTDQLPAGFNFVSSSPGIPTYNSSTGVWNIGTLNSGSSETLTLIGTPTAAGTFTNTASVTSQTEYDPTTSNNSSSTTITVSPAADLSISNTVSAGPYNAGQPVTYTVSVTNNGPSAATGVSVTDLLPAGLNFSSSSAGAGYVSGTGVWTIGNIAANQTVTLTLVATPAAVGSYTTTANITASNQFDPNTANNSSSNTITVAPSANVAVTNTVSAGPYNQGGTVTYTVTASNAGPNAATGLQLTDLLPAGLTVLNANPGAGNSYDPATGLWDIGTLASGSSQTLVLTVQLNTSGSVTTTASVTAQNEFDPNTANNSSSNTITVNPTADVAISQTVSSGPYAIGQNVTFIVSASNSGPAPATGVQITDLLPAGFTFVSANPSSGTYNSGSGIWSGIGAIASGSSQTLTLVATPNTAGTLTNTASVTSATQFDPNTANNTSSVSITVSPTSDIALTSSISPGGPYNVGDVVTYTITATNNGPSPATGVVITELIPASFTYSSSTTSSGSFNPATGQWSNLTLTNGQTATLTVTAVIGGSGTQTALANVTAQNGFDPNTANNSAATTITVAPAADIALSSFFAPGPYVVGTPTTYVVTINNLGPNAATGVTVNAPVPAGVVLQNATASTGTYNSGTGLWNVGTVAAGSSVTLVFNVIPTALGNLTVTAVKTNSAPFDPNGQNNATGNNVTSTTVTVTFPDFDGDGINDLEDEDDNNDGIPDLLASAGADPLGDADGDGIFNYLDTNFVHPRYGVFRDLNNDGINDWFDIDMDGILDIYDIDIDGDGIMNGIEANGGTVPAGFNVNTGTFTGPVNAAGVPLASLNGAGTSLLPMMDTDGDGNADFRDLDSDNDGITDNYEAQTTLGFRPLTGLDSDGDGLDDAYDPTCGCGSNGLATIPVDTDGDGTADYRDRDSDNDGRLDANEGFDNSGDGYALDDLMGRATAFAAAGGNAGFYDNTPGSNPDGVPAWLMDDDNDGIRNYLDPDSPYYHDSDQDGLIDLFDTDSFGSPASPPDNNNDGSPDFRDMGIIVPLPVELLSFNAVAAGEQVQVKWQTATEINSDYFIVERSQDGREFEPIGKVQAAGSSTATLRYGLLDQQPLPGTSYYRLKQVDLDGTFAYSSVAVVHFAGKAEMLVYPNPFSAAPTLEVSLPQDEQLQLQVLDVRGEVVYQRSVSAAAEKQQLQLPLEHLPSGTYLLRLTGRQTLLQQQLVKQR